MRATLSALVLVAGLAAAFSASAQEKTPEKGPGKAPEKTQAKGADKTSDAGLIVRDVNVGFVAKGVINDRAAFRSTVPAVVLSQRPNPPKPSDALPQPIGVLTFAGTPQENVDVMLEYDQSTKMLGRWPHTEVRSTRSLWRKVNIGPAKSNLTTPFPTNSWLNPLRNSSRLTVEKEKSVEKFILYDLSTKAPSTIELESAENGYKARHLGSAPLHHVMVYRPAGEGLYRAATASELPANSQPATPPPADGAAGQPVPMPPPGVVLEALQGLAVAITGNTPVAPGAPPGAEGQPAAPPGIPTSVPQHAITWTGEPQTPEILLAAWEPILQEQGLAAEEIAHVLAILRAHAFDKDSARLVVQLDPAAIEKLAPLEVTPQPDKLVRVWLMIIDGADPDIKTRIQTLITQLGDASYTNRMNAKAELLKLGPTAVPELTLQKTHKDAEISFRVEEILEEILTPTVTENPGAAAAALGIDF